MVRSSLAFWRKEPRLEEQSVARRYIAVIAIILSVLLGAWQGTFSHPGEDYRTLDEYVHRSADHLLPGTPWWGLSFFAVDTFLFIPVYGGLIVLLTRLVTRSLMKDGDGAHERWLDRYRLVVWAVSSVLVAADLFENGSAVLALFCVNRAYPAFHWATMVKLWLVGTVVALLLGGLWIWLAGLLLPRPEDESDDSEAQSRRHRKKDLIAQRMAFRAQMVDVVGRTRYVWLSLVLYAAILLILDQGRDVLVGLGALVDPGTSNGNPMGEFLGAAVAVLLGLIALHVYSHVTWLWGRVLARIRRKDDHTGTRTRPGHIDTFAMWWARFLGLSPWLIVLVLCGRAAGDARSAGDILLAPVLLLAGVCATVWGGFFVLWKAKEGKRTRHTTQTGAAGLKTGPYTRGDLYYNDCADPALLLSNPMYEFVFLFGRSPLWMPVLAGIGMLGVQWLGISGLEAGSCNALAGLSFGIALWTALINRLALEAIRSRAPWILGLFVVAVLLGTFGCTDNHRVLVGEAARLFGSGKAGLLALAEQATVLAVAGMAIYAVWVAIGLQKLQSEPATRVHLSRRQAILVTVLAVGVVFFTLKVHSGSGPEPSPGTSGKLPRRPALEAAVREVLSQVPIGEHDPPMTVYLVGAEGGGIRAGYWIARVLGQMDQAGLDAKGQVFAVSGVSGGSVGAGAWRSCVGTASTQAQSLSLLETLNREAECLDGFGRAELLSPLSSAWMFEDVMAGWIPTHRCAVPGCGALDRGNWFERALEGAVPGMEQPLVRPTAAGGTPYLLLNSTQVESGERSVASDLDVTAGSFPEARDQIVDAGGGLRLSTAAHDSARFPYFNPLGSLAGKGHLVDGGLAEGTGAETLDNVLEEFVRQMPDLPEEKRKHLRLTVLMVRNGVQERSEPSLDCEVQETVRPLKLLANAIGTVMAGAKAIGTGAAGRTALCKLRVDALRVAAMLSATGTGTGTGTGSGTGTAPAQADLPAYVEVRLVDRKILYPLGWYLSRRARDGMEDEAVRCVGYALVTRTGSADERVKASPLGEYAVTLKKVLGKDPGASDNREAAATKWPPDETGSPCVRAWYARPTAAGIGQASSSNRAVPAGL